MRSGFLYYILISTGLLFGMITYLLYQYDYYMYHVIMHITSTKASSMIIGNFILILVLLFSKMILSLFIGRLRDIELEDIIEQGRGFLVDTVLFLLISNPTIDNKEVGPLVLTRYITIIIGLKMLHLVAHIRVSHMFELDRPRTKNIIRIAALISILMISDIVSVFHYYNLLSRGSSLRLWLFFENITMLSSSMVSMGKYLVHIFDLRLQNLQIYQVNFNSDNSRFEFPTNDNLNQSLNNHAFIWTNKNAILFYLDIIGDVTSLLTYLVFVIIFFALNPSRVPLYVTGDVFQVIRALYQKISSFRRYRKLTKNMETKFPDANLEDIERVDTCIVCRDLLYIGSKMLPCGHIFHLDCLKSWLIQQQTCPTCRATIPITTSNQEQNTNNNRMNNTETVNDSETQIKTDDLNNINSWEGSNNSLIQGNEIANFSTREPLWSFQKSGNFELSKFSHINNNEETIEFNNESSSSNNNQNYEPKKTSGYEKIVSQHHLLTRNLRDLQIESTIRNCYQEKSMNCIKKRFEKLETSTFSDILTSQSILPPQALSFQPQLLLDVNKTLLQDNIFDDPKFVYRMCKMYRKNTLIWQRKISELIESNFISKYGFTFNDLNTENVDKDQLGALLKAVRCQKEDMEKLGAP
ncbi:zinc finger, C3HC4 type domain-containing protein [Cryptosporidium serpentis]